jgi:hypothetical protein
VSNQTTHLASGTLNGHDQLIVELVESEDAAKHPPVIAIRWPSKATVTTPAAYDQVAANVMRCWRTPVRRWPASKCGRNSDLDRRN